MIFHTKVQMEEVIKILISMFVYLKFTKMMVNYFCIRLSLVLSWMNQPLHRL